ncbi:MAG: hypothetical protein JSR18_02055 [Proteobacteria bacterium]|nr:hypothetical protein [Pseudomonadota bacterium]
MTPRTAIVVLGMHRSGTSALARTANLLGAALPRHLVPPGPGNELGHWESAEALAVDEQLLAAAGSSTHALAGPDDAWFATAAAQAFVPSMKAILAAEFGAAPLFVLKEPRMALAFPLWRRALAEAGVHCVAIIAVRNPLAVARSLAERQVAAQPESAWPCDRGGLLWLRYTLAAEAHTRGMPRVFCDYADVVADWRAETARISRELQIAWPNATAASARDVDGFLSVERCHQRATTPLADGGAIWARWVAPVYTAARRAILGERLDTACFDNVAHTYGATCAALGIAAPEHASNPGPRAALDIDLVCAVAAVRAAVDEGERRDAIAHARALEAIVAQRDRSLDSARAYAESLERALAQLSAPRPGKP